MNILVMYSTHQASQAHLSRLAKLDGLHDVAFVSDETSAIQNAPDAQAILGHRYLRQVLPVARKLRWVQSTAGGVDQLPLKSLLDAQVQLSRMTISSPMIARHALTMAWALTRGLAHWQTQQHDGLWKTQWNWPPLPRKAIIFGAGAIGAEIARLLKNEGIQVTGVRRQSGLPVKGFDSILSLNDAIEHLGEYDWCISVLPQAQSLVGVFNAQTLARLSPGAIFVNVGRGEHVVTADLIALLQRGDLAGAGLDVIHPKLSGPNDPTWRTPGLLLTPHVAAHQHERGQLIEAHCEKQLTRLIRGDSPLDLVDIAQEVQLGRVASQ